MRSTTVSRVSDPNPPRWLMPDWPAPCNVRGLVTLRAGGISAGAWGLAGGTPGGWNLAEHCGDAAADVAANRARLRALLPAEPVWLEQVHGSDVHVVARGDGTGQGQSFAGRPVADAAVTAQPGTVLAVLTADCLPVLFTNAGGDVVGVAHAGWRGLAAGVLERTVQALAGLSDDRRWIAWLGPAIGQMHFEVGDEVRDTFMARDQNAGSAFVAGARPGKWQADLYALARQRLIASGVAAILGGGQCTASDPRRFWSYRRDRVTGRMASVIWLA